MRRNPLPRLALVSAMAAAIAAPLFASPQTATEAETPRTFGGLYATLDPHQRALVDDLYRRVSAIGGRQIDPQAAYDAARLSIRTTFDAVTHALLRSTLTDAEGHSLGTALDLVQHLEAVNGKEPGVGGDQQFRMYVRLVPQARAILDRSRQFSRKGDNTVFHKGYPLNYRQAGGVPSIQISMTRDAERADVDVDYRSSKFPASLLNGHLTAANSDVRAGNNHERHNGRWEGLPAWWRGLFGLVLSPSDAYEGEKPDKLEIPPVPRAGRKSIEVAVDDFLTSWLVEGQPTRALAYVSERALACLDLDSDPEAPIDYGTAPVRLFLKMRAVNEHFGHVERLEDVTIGVRLANPALTLVKQPHHAQFVLYGVPDKVAERFECANRTRLATRPVEAVQPMRGARLEDFRYFGAALFLKARDGRGSTVLLLWEKEQGNWKIVSYETEPLGVSDEGELSDLHKPPPTAAIARASAPPGLVEASTRFLEDWLVRKDYAATFAALSRRCYPCADLFLPEGQAPAGSAQAQARSLRERIASAGERVGKVARLEDVIAAAEPVDPDVRIIDHPHERAFALLSITNGQGDAADCARRLRSPSPPPLEEQASARGRYYAAAFHVETAAGEPAVLYLGWTREEGAWRVFAYDIVLP